MEAFTPAPTFSRLNKVCVGCGHDRELYRHQTSLATMTLLQQQLRLRQAGWRRQNASDRTSVAAGARSRGRAAATPKASRARKERRGLLLPCPRCSRAETLGLQSSTTFEVGSTRKRNEIDRYTLKLLDWVNICSHVSIFTSTKLGNEECYNMEIGSDIEESLVRNLFAAYPSSGSLDVITAQTRPEQIAIPFFFPCSYEI